MNLHHFNARARAVAVWGVVGIGLVLPLPTAWANIMLLPVLIGWLCSGDWRQKWQTFKQAPAAVAVTAFIAMVLIGLLYGTGDDGSHYLTKYASLLILPLILTLKLTSAEKWRAIHAFCAAMATTLALSILIWMGWLPAKLFRGSALDNPIVFKLHITHGFFMALAALFLYIKAQQTVTHRLKHVLMAVITLMAFNVLFMIQGRTGQAVFGVMFVYLFYLSFPRYGLLIGGLSALLLGGMAYTISPTFKERINLTVEEAQHWETRRGDPSSSIGTRLDYYSTTVAIIKQHPLLGVGTKGFPEAYERQIAGTVLQPSNNPHNQYLLVTAQYGFVGLVILLGLYATVAWQAARQASPFSILAIGVLLAYVVGNLFNSFMLDFSERVFFAWGMGVLLSSNSLRQIES